MRLCLSKVLFLYPVMLLARYRLTALVATVTICILSRSVFCVFLSVLPFPHLPQSLFCLVISSTPFTCAHLFSAVPCHHSLSPQYLVSPFVHSICQIFTVTDLVYSWSTQVLVLHVKSALFVLWFLFGVPALLRFFFVTVF